MSSRQELSPSEVDAVEEEGRLFLAMRLVKSGRRQEALQALGQLRSPEAAFQRAMVSRALEHTGLVKSKFPQNAADSATNTQNVR